MQREGGAKAERGGAMQSKGKAITG